MEAGGGNLARFFLFWTIGVPAVELRPRGVDQPSYPRQRDRRRLG
jgi:hypothetical protein